MGLMTYEQACGMIGEIRKAAAAFVQCATEWNDSPDRAADYIDGIDDKITRYMRACCGEVDMVSVEGKIGLNLGCGELSYGPECLNVDIRKTSIVDVIADLNDYPWPMPSGWASFIYMTDLYEHLREAWLPLEECYRILQPKGRLFIRTGCWLTENSYTCPDHVRFPTIHTFDFFDRRTTFGAKYPHFSPARFEILTAERSGEELSFTLAKDVLDDETWDLKPAYPRRRYY